MLKAKITFIHDGEEVSQLILPVGTTGYDYEIKGFKELTWYLESLFPFLVQEKEQVRRIKESDNILYLKKREEEAAAKIAAEKEAREVK